VEDRIPRLLAESPVVDGHNDLPWELRQRAGGPPIDLTVDQSGIGLHTDLPRFRAGGVGAQFWSVYVPSTFANPVTATLEQIDLVRGLVARYPDHLMLATSADEMEHARETGRIASLIGMEGGQSIDSSLGALRMMHALGARYLTLTHFHNTPWADSATDEPVVGGLSEFGRDVVRECNRLGVLADLAHVADTTMHATLDVSFAPAFFSHSNARALCGHVRNVPDDVLTRVRDSDGIVMVTFVPGFLREDCREWIDALIKEYGRLAAEYGEGTDGYAGGVQAWLTANPRPPCTVADVADHVEYVREVAGVDHVGLGGDFDGVAATPDGLSGVDGYPTLLEELARRGWADAELAKLTWHNAVRVVRDTEAAARALAGR
jgi:membrane dipeptidase